MKNKLEYLKILLLSSIVIFVALIPHFAHADVVKPPSPTPTNKPTLTPTPTPLASSYSSVIKSDSPVAYFRLGETSGSSAQDEISAGPAGTYQNSPALGKSGAISGDTNTAVGFDGTSQYASIPFSSALNSSKFSVEAWAYPASAVSGKYKAVVGSRVTISNVVKGWTIYADNNNMWALWIWTSAGVKKVTSTVAVKTNTWTYLAATYDGTNAKLYINNNNPASLAVSSSSYSKNPSGPEEIAQGEPGKGYFFPGEIDEVAFYGSALSGTKIAAHYAAGACTGTACGSPTATPAGSPSTTPTSTPSPTPAIIGTCGDKNQYVCTADKYVGVIISQTTLSDKQCTLNALKTNVPSGTSVTCCATGQAKYGQCGTNGSDVCIDTSSCSPAASVVYTEVVPSDPCAIAGAKANLPKGTVIYCENNSLANPTPTIPPQDTAASMTLYIPEVGRSGAPLHPVRQIHAEVFNSSNTKAADVKGGIDYAGFDQNTGLATFSGTLDFGPSLATGLYTLKLTVPGFLRKQIPGIVQLTSAAISPLSSIAVVGGDVNADNTLDLLDYTALLGCYGGKAGTSSCISPDLSDINDDGVIDIVDLNMFLRNLATRNGD